MDDEEKLSAQFAKDDPRARTDKDYKTWLADRLAACERGEWVCWVYDCQDC